MTVMPILMKKHKRANNPTNLMVFGSSVFVASTYGYIYLIEYLEVNYQPWYI